MADLSGCEHTRLIETGYSTVCTDCGIERIVCRLDTFNATAAPLGRNYDRINRFRVKIDRLLGESAPSASDKVWGYLEGRTFPGPCQIRAALRRAPFRLKHYDSGLLPTPYRITNVMYTTTTLPTRIY